MKHSSVYFKMCLQLLQSWLIGSWMFIGKLIGIVLVTQDKDGKFYCTERYKIFSIVLSVLFTVTFPYAYTKLAQRVKVANEVDVDFAIVVTAIRDYIDYIFMIVAFIFHRYNRHNLANWLNGVAEFAEKNKNQCGVFIRTAKRKHRKYLSIGIVSKFLKLLMNLLSWWSVVNFHKRDIVYVFIIFIPKLIVFVVSNEYFAGVLTIKFYLGMINDKLQRMRTKIKFKSSEKLRMLNRDLELCDEFYEISEMHTRLFKIYKDLSGMYQFQLILLIFSLFYALMIDLFYVFNVTFFHYINLTSTMSGPLKAVSIFSVIVRGFDIYYMLKCSTSVSYAENVNMKMMACVDITHRDQRLKDCVRLFGEFGVVAIIY